MEAPASLPRPGGVWAGTEVASRWPGDFEGAIEAGFAAAEQVAGAGGLRAGLRRRGWTCLCGLSPACTNLIAEWASCSESRARLIRNRGGGSGSWWSQALSMISC